MTMTHTEHCIDMAIMSIIENNEATRALEPNRTEHTPETRNEVLEWLANGNVMCHEPERCAELARSRIRVQRCEAFAVKGTGYGSCDAILDKRGQCPYARSHRDSHPGRHSVRS